MKTIRALFKSRKFVAALAAALGVLFVQLGLDEAAAETVSEAIVLLGLAYIGGTTIEDAALKLKK